MATSKCLSCKKAAAFEIQLKEVTGYTFHLNFIQCASCGAVVGVASSLDPGVLADGNAKALVDLKKRLVRIESAVEAFRAQR
jgi:hypothetical protein